MRKGYVVYLGTDDKNVRDHMYAHEADSLEAALESASDMVSELECTDDDTGQRLIPPYAGLIDGDDEVDVRGVKKAEGR
jgi:hypothetical protein